jgi:hypothetical protein
MSLKGLSVSGRVRSDGVDYYATPEWATEELIKREKFEGLILEPCSGAGAISKVLEREGYSVISSDIREDDHIYGDKGVDLLSIESTEARNVVTNPPFFMATESVEKSLELIPDGGKVAMILKIQFLEGQKRYNFFQNTPLRRVYVFCKRVVFWNELMQPDDGNRSKHGGTIAFAWYVWEKGYKGKPEIEWIL